MTSCPFETVFQIFILSKLITIANNPEVFSRFSLVLDFESDAVKLMTHPFSSGVRAHISNIVTTVAHQVEPGWICGVTI